MPKLFIPPRIPRPVLENEQLYATVCVPSQYASFLPVGAEIVGTDGEYTFALIRMNINDVFGGYGWYIIQYEDSQLGFTFHCDIAEEAVKLLERGQSQVHTVCNICVEG
jgi:hypothetical protein